MTRATGWVFIFAAFGLSAGATPSGVAAAPSNAVRAAYWDCRREAEWPAYHTLAYKHWNARQRESVVAADTPDVADMQALCQSMFAAGSVDRTSLMHACQDDVDALRARFGTDADTHARRMLAICRVAATGA